MDKKELKKLRRPFIKVLFKNNKINLLMTSLASILQSIGALSISWLIKELSDLIAGTSQYDFKTIIIVTIISILIFVVAWVIDRIFYPRFFAKPMKQYRDYVFERLMKKGIQSFSSESSALYISALSNDIKVIEEEFIGKIQTAIQVTVTFIGSLVLMIIYSPLLSAIAILLSLLPIIVSIIFGNKAAIAEKDVSNNKEKYLSLTKDILTGFTVIKSFKAEKNVSTLHNDVNKGVSSAQKKRAGINVHISYSSGIAGGLVQMGVFIVACAFALNGIGNITAGTAIIFVQLLNYVLLPIQTLPTFYAGVKSSFALIDKIAIELDKNIDESGEDIAPELKKGIFIRNLSFSYDEDKKVLKNINLDFKEGGCYALVGGSGSGKSTLLNLLMASYRNYEGEIFFDDLELGKVSTHSLYNLVSIIQQNVFVFNNTIQDNITMFKEFNEDEINQAIKSSGLEKLINERGKDYLCGENGSGLSGGERQRISIARALLRKTPVLLVDEATSALDKETSFEVLDAILKLKEHTRIIVTHDLDENVLRRCSELLVLKNGEVIEKGSFDALMDKKGYFYSLYTVSQNN